MKKGKKQWLQICNRLLSGAPVLLGFTACDVIGGDEPCMYGQPHADFEIKGKVQNSEEQPIENARVIVKEMPPVTSSYYSGRKDTLYTGATGEYIFSDKLAWPVMGYRVVCEDPGGVYKADSTDVEMHPAGGEGWYGGGDSKEVNFKLKKKEK